MAEVWTGQGTWVEFEAPASYINIKGWHYQALPYPNYTGWAHLVHKGRPTGQYLYYHKGEHKTYRQSIILTSKLGEALYA